MTVTNKQGVAETAVAHPRPDIGQALLMEALGTADLDFWDGLIRQLANAGAEGTLEERGLNFILALVKGIEPRDQIEAMLRRKWRQSTRDHDLARRLSRISMAGKEIPMSSIVSGRQLRAARVLAGLTQAQFAAKAGFHERACRYWEAKGDQPPTSVPSTLAKINAGP